MIFIHKEVHRREATVAIKEMAVNSLRLNKKL
jgi:hypothetical protein